ncbi:MAG: signal peptidase II, partial [Atribacterota bacterium]|nr:signal peptidase II [Atribacterota bacterium]
DFLNFGIGNLRTGILNIADMAITFGVILLIYSFIVKTEL